MTDAERQRQATYDRMATAQHVCRDETAHCTCTAPEARFTPECPAHGGLPLRIQIRVAEEAGADDRPGVARLTAIIHGVVGEHWRHPAPGPNPSHTGACGTCGGTGEVYHGTGEAGHVFAGACGCDQPYCGNCGEAWPCDTIRTAAFCLQIDPANT